MSAPQDTPRRAAAASTGSASGPASSSDLDPSPLPDLALLGEGPPHPRLQEAALEVGDHPGDHAQARRDGAHRRLPPDADPADRRRHLLRHRADLPRARAPRAEPPLYPAESAGLAASWRSGPTRRCSGPRCRSRCSPRARARSSPMRRPSACKAFADDRAAMSPTLRARRCRRRRRARRATCAGSSRCSSTAGLPARQRCRRSPTSRWPTRSGSCAARRRRGDARRHRGAAPGSTASPPFGHGDAEPLASDAAIALAARRRAPRRRQTSRTPALRAGTRSASRPPTTPTTRSPARWSASTPTSSSSSATTIAPARCTFISRASDSTSRLKKETA